MNVLMHYLKIAQSGFNLENPVRTLTRHNIFVMKHNHELQRQHFALSCNYRLSLQKPYDPT